MRTSKILLLLSAILFLGSCSNDEDSYNYLDTKKVTEVEDFVDERDGKTYKCVKIGNQIWMAENLAYYVPKGQLAGCYNWGEVEIDIEGLQAELDQKEAAGELTPEIYFNMFVNLYYSKNWGAEDDIIWDYYYWTMYYMVRDGSPTIEECNAFFIENTPTFWKQFETKLAVYIKTAEEIVLERTKEQSNKYANNFIKEEGYYYTLDGALAAVPEGWRLPSDEDWKKLDATLGMSGDLDAMNAWRGENAGDYLKAGGEAKFNTLYAGCNAWVYNKDKYNYFINHDYSAYFWCSDETTITETEEEEDEEGNVSENTYVVREGIVRQVSIYSSKIWRGTTRIDGVCYSVRCVKDAN